MKDRQRSVRSMTELRRLECALVRGRGLVHLLVRGLAKVKAVALWFAIAHNVVCGARLRARKVTWAV